MISAGQGVSTMNQIKEKILSDVMYAYGHITVYSGNGGIIFPWDRDLLKHYANRRIVFMWVNPVNCDAYIQIR